jgi:hypothetical protein
MRGTHNCRTGALFETFQAFFRVRKPALIPSGIPSAFTAALVHSSCRSDQPFPTWLNVTIQPVRKDVEPTSPKSSIFNLQSTIQNAGSFERWLFEFRLI